MHKGPQSQNYANQLERIKTRYQQAQIQIKQLQNRINLEKNLGASLELQVLLKGKFRELVEEKKSVEILIEQEIKRINELDDMSALAARGELAALNKLKTEAAGFQLFDPEEMVIPVLDEEWVKAENILMITQLQNICPTKRNLASCTPLS